MLHRLLKHCSRHVPYKPSIPQARSNQTAASPSATQYAARWTTKVSVRPNLHVNPLAPPHAQVENEVLTVIDHGKRVAVPGRWLRDNCACAKCRNAETAQRQVNVFKTPEAGKVIKAVEQKAGEDTSFEVTFADGHSSIIPMKLIKERRNIQTLRSREGLTETELWGRDVSTNPPTVGYEAIQEPIGMGKMLHHIRRYGFCFIDNMPATPDATRALLEGIGPIRNTHYGGFYDFTSDLSSKDTAYTSESLEPHTDTTYFTDPIGLQALHLLSHTDGEGGLSSLVDGFGAAKILFDTNREAYATLSRSKVYAHASGNEDVSIQPMQSYPVLNHTPGRGYLVQVRWNTADRAGIDLPMGPIMDQWYDAAAEFDRILSQPENQYWFQLKPGKMLIFDNWRVLHGRSAFTGKRRMCGGYINRDDFISKYRMLNLTKEEHASSTMTG